MVNIKPVSEGRQVGAPQGQTRRSNKQELEDEVRNANKEVHNQGIKFGIYDNTGIPYVQVVDNKTGKVLKTMPPQEFLELKEHMKDNVGNIINKLA